jgi:hypothetical protein
MGVLLVLQHECYKLYGATLESEFAYVLIRLSKK